MISKASSIAHTKASIKYGWNNEKEAEIVLNQHLIGCTPGELSKEFAMVQRLNTRCTNNTISVVISPCIEDRDKLNKSMLKRICERFMKDLQMGNRQAIAFVHNDKPHKHIHLYINRIDFNGKTYNDSFISKKCQDIAEKVAIDLSLTTVKDIQNRKLNATKAIRTAIFKKHQAVLKQRPASIDKYLEFMKKENIGVQAIINKSNQLQGFRFQYKGSDYKGSEVNRKLTGSNILKELSPFLKITNDNKIKIGGEIFSLNHNLEKALNQNKGNNRNKKI